jgi:hypothetical protein
MGTTSLGRVKQFCSKEGIDLSFYQYQVFVGLKWCFKCRCWKYADDDFSTDNSRYDKKKAKCNTCCRVKVKMDTKGRVSAFKGKKHSAEVIEKFKRINSGKNNPNWKGGITILLIQIRNTERYKKWRYSVYLKDKFTCVECGEKKIGNNLILDADHINPLAKMVFDNNIKTVEEALLCDEIFEVSNGRCLCRPCHKKTDTWGVNVNKKKQQWEKRAA